MSSNIDQSSAMQSVYYEDDTLTNIEHWSLTKNIQTNINQYSVSSVYLEMLYPLVYQIQIQLVSSYVPLIYQPLRCLNTYSTYYILFLFGTHNNYTKGTWNKQYFPPDKRPNFPYSICLLFCFLLTVYNKYCMGLVGTDCEWIYMNIWTYTA